jgi:hypothetical protein
MIEGNSYLTLEEKEFLVVLRNVILRAHIFGCTTGILKDDLSKMELISKKMKAELRELFNHCSLTPIVVTSEPISISDSDAQFAVQSAREWVSMVFFTLLKLCHASLYLSFKG